MDIILVALCFAAVIALYFRHNPMNHSSAFLWRRFINWFPLGMTYAFLYMARYNLNVSKNALGEAMTKEDFGLIFGAGTFVYGLSFLVNGPLVDRFGGRKGILLAAIGACLANAAMGVVTYLHLNGHITSHLTLIFALLYSCNMYFQSYGAVSIIKVKAYWFHVRERGIFGAIFGTLISFGVYFAFDWGQAIATAAKSNPAVPTRLHSVFETLFAVNTQPVDSIWLVFLIPSAFLVFWTVTDYLLIRDTPGEAGFDDFDTHDASSGEMDKTFSTRELLHRILTSRSMLIFAAIEFTGGVIRNGIMQWYTIFAKEVPQPGAEFFSRHWGLLLCFFGIFGGFAGGLLSDKFFQSRRAPPVALACGSIFICAILMALFLRESPAIVAVCALTMIASVIAVHSLMSGTAAADFGGRKATATASGIIDGFVYLGSGLQSVSLGYLVSKSWLFWPVFMAPFALIGLCLAIRIWKDLPEATRRYLLQVERLSASKRTLKLERERIQVLTAIEHRPD